MGEKVECSAVLRCNSSGGRNNMLKRGRPGREPHVFVGVIIEQQGREAENESVAQERRSTNVQFVVLLILEMVLIVAAVDPLAALTHIANDQVPPALLINRLSNRYFLSSSSSSAIIY